MNLQPTFYKSVIINLVNGMKFSYKAQSKKGEIVEGVIEAPDKYSAARMIRDQGLSPISTKEFKSAHTVDELFNKLFGKIKLQEKILFTRNLSGMLKAGLALSRALEVLEKQTKNLAFKKVLNSLMQEVSSGGSLSSGLAKNEKVFSTLFISIVRAGEESGNLADSLHEVGINLEKAYNMNRKVKGAMMYPGIIMSAVVLIGILMFIFVVPTITKTFVELKMELPATTKLIIGVSDLFSNYAVFMLLGIVGLIVGIYYLAKVRVVHDALDKLFTKLPLIGELVRQVNAARTARTLSSLLSAGVDITKAISITKDVVQNVHYKRVLEKTISDVQKGVAMSESFKEASNLYPIMVGEMISVGEETGKISDMLLSIAIFFEEEVENKTKNLSTIIEPVLMIVIGAAVGFFALAMITPMYSLVDGIQ